jgi:hypothetical protein
MVRSDTPEPLDDLVARLLECGAVLGQMVAAMVEFQASGRSAPDAAPIPEVAHSLVRGELVDLLARHGMEDIALAAKIVREATDAISDGIFILGPPR